MTLRTILTAGGRALLACLEGPKHRPNPARDSDGNLLPVYPSLPMTTAPRDGRVILGVYFGPYDGLSFPIRWAGSGWVDNATGEDFATPDCWRVPA